MGYEDRDYMQNSGGGDGSSIMPGYPVCRFLIIANIVLFVFQIFSTRSPTESEIERHRQEMIEVYSLNEVPEWVDPNQELSEQERQLFIEQALDMPIPTRNVSVVEEWLKLDTDKVLHGQVWRLITNTFLHDRLGVLHIAFNMLFLYWFGRELEDLYGHREFLAFYLTAGVIASVAFVVLQMLIGERVPAIGASGAVMAVVCLYAIHHPTHTINLFFVLPVQIRFLVLMYVIFDLHPVLLKLAGIPVYTGTAHAAHLGGLLFGYLYYRFEWTLEPAVNSLTSLIGSFKGGTGGRRIRSGRSGKAEGPRLQRLEENLDSILQKISDEGEDSLTERERKILEEASRHYRNQDR